MFRSNISVERALQLEMCRQLALEYSTNKYELTPYLAAINLLKIEYENDASPEVYRMLITLLHDYNPKLGSEHRRQTEKYIKLLLNARNPELCSYLIWLLPEPVKTMVPAFIPMHRLPTNIVLSKVPVGESERKPTAKAKFYNFTKPSIKAYVAAQGVPNRIIPTKDGSTGTMKAEGSKMTRKIASESSTVQVPRIVIVNESRSKGKVVSTSVSGKGLPIDTEQRGNDAAVALEALKSKLLNKKITDIKITVENPNLSNRSEGVKRKIDRAYTTTSYSNKRHLSSFPYCQELRLFGDMESTYSTPGTTVTLASAFATSSPTPIVTSQLSPTNMAPSTATVTSSSSVVVEMLNAGPLYHWQKNDSFDCPSYDITSPLESLHKMVSEQQASDDNNFQ